MLVLLKFYEQFREQVENKSLASIKALAEMMKEKMPPELLEKMGLAGFGIAAVNDAGDVVATEVVGDIPDGDVRIVEKMIRKKAEEEAKSS